MKTTPKPRETSTHSQANENSAFPLPPDTVARMNMLENPKNNAISAKA